MSPRGQWKNSALCAVILSKDYHFLLPVYFLLATQLCSGPTRKCVPRDNYSLRAWSHFLLSSSLPHPVYLCILSVRLSDCLTVCWWVCSSSCSHPLPPSPSPSPASSKHQPEDSFFLCASCVVVNLRIHNTTTTSNQSHGNFYSINGEPEVRQV